MSRKKKQVPNYENITLEIPNENFDPVNPVRSDLITDYMTIQYFMDYLASKGITKEMFSTTKISIATERFGNYPHFILSYQKQRSPEEIKELEKKAEEEEARKIKESLERKKRSIEKKKKKEELNGGKKVDLVIGLELHIKL